MKLGASRMSRITSHLREPTPQREIRADSRRLLRFIVPTRGRGTVAAILHAEGFSNRLPTLGRGATRCGPGQPARRRCLRSFIYSFAPRQRVGTDPTGVVVPHPLIVVEDGPCLSAVTLVIHSMPGQWFHLPAEFAMEVGVLIPADGREEEVAHEPGRLGW